MNDKKWQIPTVNDVRATNERNRRYNEAIGRSAYPYEKPANDWKEIRKDMKARRGPVSPWRVWATGFVWGALTFAAMSYLTWLAWRAF